MEADDSYGQTYGADCSLGYSAHGIYAEKIDKQKQPQKGESRSDIRFQTEGICQESDSDFLEVSLGLFIDHDFPSTLGNHRITELAPQFR